MRRVNSERAINGVTHKRHPILAALSDIVKSEKLSMAKLSAIFGDGRKARIMLETQGNPGIWTVEQLANLLGYRLALEKRPPGEPADRDMVDGFRLSQNIVESLHRLKKGNPMAQNMRDVRALGWEVDPAAAPMVKVLMLHMAARDVTPKKFFAGFSGQRRTMFGNWLKGKSEPMLGVYVEALRVLGLGIKIVPIHEADEFLMSEAMARGIGNPKEDRRATVYEGAQNG